MKSRYRSLTVRGWIRFLGLVASTVASSALVVTGCSWIALRDVYEPVYLSYGDLRAQTSSVEPVPMRETGKIYVKDDYLYVNELFEGIHVVDNSNPASPTVISFIPIPGNVDIAIRGTMLYADSFVDLVVIDIGDPTNALEVNRIENAFPYDPWITMATDFGSWDEIYEAYDEEEGIVLRWEKSGRRVEVSNPFAVYGVFTAIGGDSTGTGGSLARMAIVDTWLYVLHQSQIKLFSIVDPGHPSAGTAVDVAWDIETLFPYGDLLFIGSMSGMYIFDNTDPAAPVELSRFAHVTSCDPVVVAGDRAYVTLRSGSLCGGGEDRLDFIDISNLASPELTASFPMDGPYGLGIDAGTLFVCDGTSGLKIFTVASDTALEPLATFPEREVFDVILVAPIAIVVGPDGIDQYDYANPDAIELVSHLDIVGRE